MLSFFFFNDPPTTEIYPLSLHDALPICGPSASTASATRPTSSGTTLGPRPSSRRRSIAGGSWVTPGGSASSSVSRSEEHTSELQSRQYLVCRLLLEKKKKQSLNMQ